MQKPFFHGLRTIVYPAPDLPSATAWYADAFGCQPSCDEPFYVGFNIGSFELGLDPSAAPSTRPSEGAVTYWGVSNAGESYARLLQLGAQPHSTVREVGEGIRVGSV